MARLLAMGLLAGLLLAPPCQALRLPPWGPGKCEALSEGSVVLRTTEEGAQHWSLESPAVEGGVAWGSFLDSSATPSNFGQLRITTSGEYSDVDQLYAAGYLEGFLTAPRIWDNWVNMRAYFTEAMGAEVEEPMKWMQEQDHWLRGQCAAREAGAPEAPRDGQQQQEARDGRFWQAVCLLVRQFDGLKAGYRARRAELAAAGNGGAAGHMSDWDFLFLESSGDLYDIIDWMQPDQRPSWIQDPAAEPAIPTLHPRTGGRHWAALEAAAAVDPEAAAAKLFSKVALSGKCSALVKVAADLSDIWMGHSTWDTYTAMLRIFKHYTFNLTQLQPAANRLSFSSYPGELFSDDDLFITDAQLVVMQTTNKIFNDELFERLSTRSALSWQRVRAANWLASSGEEWARVLETHNSGTYNSQYLVVDLKRFQPGQELQPGLLWVAEQIPGLVVAADMTSTLAMGYWPSFNVPYFPEVYNASGYPDFISRVEKYGQHFGRTTHWLSWQTSPRASIFRRDQAAVADLEGMKRLMRSNTWRTDPLSENHPLCAICARGDLDPANPVARGCYDSKTTSWSLAMQMQADVVNGPTSDGWPWSVPPFRWSEPVVANLTHRGQPERFAGFRFERMDPTAPPTCCPRAGSWWPWGCGAAAGADGTRAEAATLASGLLSS